MPAADAGGLASHASYGRWVEPHEPNSGVHQDGWFRAALPFEPLCNCPESGHDGEVGLQINGYRCETLVHAYVWGRV